MKDAASRRLRAICRREKDSDFWEVDGDCFDRDDMQGHQLELMGESVAMGELLYDFEECINYGDFLWWDNGPRPPIPALPEMFLRFVSEAFESGLLMHV